VRKWLLFSVTCIFAQIGWSKVASDGTYEQRNNHSEKQANLFLISTLYFEKNENQLNRKFLDNLGDRGNINTNIVIEHYTWLYECFLLILLILKWCFFWHLVGYPLSSHLDVDFQDYNATVEFYWDPFFAESNSDDVCIVLQICMVRCSVCFWIQCSPSYFFMTNAYKSMQFSGHIMHVFASCCPFQSLLGSYL
jgi:hypothetical protein